MIIIVAFWVIAYNKSTCEKGILKRDQQSRKVPEKHHVLMIMFNPQAVMLRMPHLFFFFLLFRAAPVAFGSSQARGQIRAIAASLHHSYSNTRSAPHLQPTPQLTDMSDP